MTPDVSDGSKNAEVMLLWTGGWDSTFRLLWLSWIEGRTVQPLYIAEEGRASTAAELSAMKKILAEIQAGEFAKAWMEENRSGRKGFLAMREKQQTQPIEAVGAELREMMTFLNKKKVEN